MKNVTVGSLSMLITLAGIVVLGAGVLLNLPFLYGAGGGLFGMGIAVSGIDNMIRGEATVGGRRRQRQSYTGMRARLVGLFNIMIGLVVVVGSYFVWRDNSTSGASIQELTRSELGISIAIIGLGILFAFWSLIRVLGSDSDNRSGGAIVLSLPLRLISFIFVLIGVGMVLYGFARIAAPQWIDVAMSALRLRFMQ